MARRLVKISVRFKRGDNALRFEEIQRRLKAPMQNGGAQVVAKAMRFGKGSVQDQFQRQIFLSRRGASSPWRKTKPFGNRPAPERTLHRTGALENAWLGRGSGSFTIWTNNRVRIGVSPIKFPQAAMFQRETPTLIRPKTKAADGQWAMRWYLGLTYDVWISNRRLERGLLVHPRRVGVSREMQRRVAKHLVRHLAGKTSRTGSRVRRRAA